MDLGTLLLGGAGGTASTALVGAVVLTLWKTREKKRDDAEEAVEKRKAEDFADLKRAMTEGFQRVESSIGQTQDSQRRSEGEVSKVNATINQMTATLSAVDARVQGISADHGPRLRALEVRAEREDAIKDFVAQSRRLPPQRKRK